MGTSVLKLRVEPGIPPTLHAAGELDFQNCEELNRLIRETMDTSGPVVAISLCGLDFVDSSGLRILLMNAKDALGRSGKIRIISTTPQVQHMLGVSGFESLFEIDVPPGWESLPVEVTPTADTSCCLDLLPAMSSCRDARNTICDFAAGIGCDPNTIDDIRLALGEAVSNAIRHGTKDGNISIRANKKDDRLIVKLRYPSSQFDPDQVPKPDISSGPTGGMGIYFMRIAMDEVKYYFEDGHANLELVKLRDNGQDEGRKLH